MLTFRPSLFMITARVGSHSLHFPGIAMKTDDGLKTKRREFLRAATAGLALGALPYTARVASGADKGLKIGIIGSGRIGGRRGTK